MTIEMAVDGTKMTVIEQWRLDEMRSLIRRMIRLLRRGEMAETIEAEKIYLENRGEIFRELSHVLEMCDSEEDYVMISHIVEADQISLTTAEMTAWSTESMCDSNDKTRWTELPERSWE